MSWRDILSVPSLNETTTTQNSQNPHNTHVQDNNAYCANFTQGELTLFNALYTICQNLPITAAELYEALSQQDVNDWLENKLCVDELIVFANSLIQHRLMNKGIRPSHYKHQATCKQCGPIWLWISEEVLGCPWCWNKATDKPIPCPF